MQKKILNTLEEFKAAKEYWMNKLSGEAAELKIPVDYAKPYTYIREETEIILESAMIDKLLSISKNQDSLLFVVLTAAFKALLYKYTHQNEIVVGSPIYGDECCEYNKCVILSDCIREGMEFKELLMNVKHTVSGGYENQHFPVEKIAELLKLGNQDLYFFNAILLLENIHNKEILADITQSYRNYLTLSFSKEEDRNIRAKVIYNRNFFEPKTIQRFTGHLLHVFDQVLKNVNIRLDDLVLMTEVEKQQVLFDFNNTKFDYPSEKTMHQLFEEQVDKTPDHTAVVFGEESITYRELDLRANQLAHYIRNEYPARPDYMIGIFMDNNIEQIISMLGVLKAGCAYVPLSKHFPEDRLKVIIEDAQVELLISMKKHIKSLNRLQWDCKTLKAYILMDSENVYDEQEVEKSSLMDEELWKYVGEKATDDIEGGGWMNSYTGENISRLEMDEYGDNILKKLMPYLNKNTRILEIGCASGISMFRIAPHVEFFYGTDLSDVIIEKDRKRAAEESMDNIKLACFPAHEIDQIDEKDFDIVILNSVVQTFSGHNYLKQVIQKILGLMKEEGFIFFGDIMDQDLKDALMESLFEFKKNHPGYSTKTDFSTEMFLSRAFFEDLTVEFDEITDMSSSGKIFTVENELTKFRYDAFVYVKKNGSKLTNIKKHKYQHDLRNLKGYGFERPASQVGSRDLAYAIFTSGTTGRPKGVLIEHRGIVNLKFIAGEMLGMNENERMIRFAYNTFDASVWEVYMALYFGAQVHIIPEEVIGNYYLFEEYMKKYQLTTGLLPPTYIANLSPDCFGSITYLLIGGSSSSISLYNKYKDKFTYYNVYGPTETTVISAGWFKRELNEHATSLPIGKPLLNTRLYVVDKNNTAQPVGIEGELCISSDSLSRGYLNLPELTAEKYVPNPNVPGEMMYKTGDLARWLPDGNIEYLGRIDHQVKIRGFRIELLEIESRIRDFENVKDAVVVALKDNNEDMYLCAYVVSEIDLDVGALKEYLSRCLADYMVPQFILQLSVIPLTKNGKLDKKALPKPMDEMMKRAKYEPASNEIEQKLVDLWQDILQVPMIGVNDNFFELGGHSLKATMLSSRIHKELNVNVPIGEVFKNDTIKSLAQYIMNSDRSMFASIEKIPESDYYPVSSAQKRIYILSLLEGAQTSYNMPGATVIVGKVDKKRLEETFKALVKRHETLRTSFELVDGEPVQVISNIADIDLEYIEVDSSQENIKDLVNGFMKPFDLKKAPLMRVGLIKVCQKEENAEETFILNYDMHHIISDGMSMGILIKEFIDLYNGNTLPEMRIQYKDFAHWQNNLLKSQFKKQEQFWLDRFEGEISILNLPYDFPRPPLQSFEGDKVVFALTEEMVLRLNAIANETGCTMFMVLLAAYNVFLYKYSRQEDVVVGTPIAGRPHADLLNIIGMFVNTLAIRNYPTGEKTFKELLEEVKVHSIQAFENQDYQFEELVNQLNIPRDFSRNPVFDTMFTMQNVDIPEVEINNLKFFPYEFEYRISKFDLSLTGFESYGSVFFELEYCTRLFKKETIEKMAKDFTGILEKVLINPEIHLVDIDLLSKEDKQKILTEFNNTAYEYPKDQTVIQLFEKQAKRTPDNTAVVFGAEKITYRELDEKAGGLAAALLEKGIMAEDVVGLLLDRSIEMIIAILAVLKAGAAYLPMDPEHPSDRLHYILNDSSCKAVITKTYFKEKISFEGPVIFADESLETVKKMCPVVPGTHPKNLAYIIYTSGSTGNPKGVLIEQRNLLAYIHAFLKEYKVSDKDVVLQLASYCFDAFVEEVYPVLIQGGKLVIPLMHEIMDIKVLEKIISDNGVTLISSSPLLLNELNQLPPLASVRTFISGGDVLKQEYITNLMKYSTVYNSYGPTEGTVCATYYQCIGEDESTMPIGKPIANTKVYIIDENCKLCPVGIPGELAITGAGIARGYLNRPELTDEKFMYNPFIEPGFTSEEEDYQRLYKTGDLVRWLSDGNIEFLGRIDQQVKIRGFRIELGEIEAQLLSVEHVKEAVVNVYESSVGDTTLCAYMVMDEDIDVNRLKEQLALKLPYYMMPSYFIQIESIPVTSNGKINRKALPKPEMNVRTTEYISPQNEIQEKLAVVWQEVLGIEQVGIHDNFFEIGGNSILLIRMHSKIDALYPNVLGITHLFMLPTISMISQYIEGAYSEFTGSVSLRPVTLQPEYFEENPAGNVEETFNFQIIGELYEKLIQSAAKYEVEVKDILVSMYVYLLSEITEEEAMHIQTMTMEKDQVLSLEVNVGQVESSVELLMMVHRSLRSSENAFTYPVNLIERFKASKEDCQVIPMFYVKELMERKVELMDLYDVVVEMSEQIDRINFNAQYNVRRLSEKRMVELLNKYVKLIKAFLKYSNL